MAIDLAALALTLETRGLTEAQRGLLGLDEQGKKTAATFDRTAQAAKAVGTSALDVTRQLMAQEAQAKGNAEALANLQQQARDTFQRIALDVGRATADYKVGIISLEDYRQAIAFAKQEAIQLRAQTGALSPAQLAAFDKVLNDISRSAQLAARAGSNVGSRYADLGTVINQSSTTVRGGVNRMISSFTQMGVAALGTRSAVGQLATGALTSFGATAGEVLLVTAGIAAIGYVFDKLTESSNKLKDAVKSLRDELDKPTKATVLEATKEALQRDLESAQRALSVAQAGTGNADARARAARLGLAVPTQVDPKAVERAQLAIAHLQKQLQDIDDQQRNAALDEATRLTDQNLKQVALNQATALELDQIKTQIQQYRALAEADTDPERRLRYLELARRDEEALDNVRSRSLDLLKTRIALGLNATAAAEGLRAKEAELSGEIDHESTNTERLIRLLKERSDVVASLDAIETRRIALLTTLADLHMSNADTVVELRKEEARLSNEIEHESTNTERLVRLLRERADLQDRIAKLAPPASRNLGALRDQTLAPPPDQRSIYEGPVAGVPGAIPALLQGRGGALGAGFSPEHAKRLLHLEELRKSMAEQIRDSIGGGIADGFAAVFAGGSIAKGFKALAATMLQGIGNAAIQFGVASIAIGSLMQTIISALASLGPIGAIAAGAALVALGGKLAGAAHSAFGGGGGGSTSGGETIIHRVFVGSDGSVRDTQPSQAVAAYQPQVSVPITRDMSTLRRPQQTTYNFTLIGANDPTVQAGIADIVNKASNRGLVSVG